MLCKWFWTIFSLGCPWSLASVNSAPQVKSTIALRSAVISWMGRDINYLLLKIKYVLSEYNDVFECIGKLPGGPYHIVFSSNLMFNQYTPRAVPEKKKPAYEEELESLELENLAAHSCLRWYTRPAAGIATLLPLQIIFLQRAQILNGITLRY